MYNSLLQIHSIKRENMQFQGDICMDIWTHIFDLFILWQYDNRIPYEYNMCPNIRCIPLQFFMLENFMIDIICTTNKEKKIYVYLW